DHLGAVKPLEEPAKHGPGVIPRSRSRVAPGVEVRPKVVGRHVADVARLDDFPRPAQRHETDPVCRERSWGLALPSEVAKIEIDRPIEPHACGSPSNQGELASASSGSKSISHISRRVYGTHFASITTRPRILERSQW